MPVLPSDTDSQKQMLSSKIEELNLSVRAYNSLKCARINTVGQIIDLQEDGVSKIRNLGQLQLDEIFDSTAKFFGISRISLITLTLEQSIKNPVEKEDEAPTEVDELSQGVDFADFAELFTLAQNKALNRRENKIVELRYGFTGGEAHTLEEIGKQIGVSQERIRQILDKCQRKIVARGKRDIRVQQSNEPCGALLLYVNQTIRPKDENAIERLVDFIENELPYLPVTTHTLPLITHLVFHNRKASKKYFAEVRRIIKKRGYERKQAS